MKGTNMQLVRTKLKRYKNNILSSSKIISPFRIRLLSERFETILFVSFHS